MEISRPVRSALTVAAACLVSSLAVQAQDLELVSVTPEGAASNSASRPAISADGSRIVFRSTHEGGIDGQGLPIAHVYLRDRNEGTTIRLSTGSGGAAANGTCRELSISDDGHFAAFTSDATNLVAGTVGTLARVYLVDLASQTITLASVATDGTEANQTSTDPILSSDGRYLAFGSSATNLSPLDSTGSHDIYLRDLQSGTTELISVSTAETGANGACAPHAVSADGRYVLFYSQASNLHASDSGTHTDYFLRDRTLETTELISVSTTGTGGNSHFFGSAVMSADARFVAFLSYATNLVADDTNTRADIFLRDRQTSTTTRVNRRADGTQTTQHCGSLSMTSDGAWIGYSCSDSQIVANDANGLTDLFLWKRSTDVTERLVPRADGVEANASVTGRLAGNGLSVLAESTSTNLSANDGSSGNDLFYVPLSAATFELDRGTLRDVSKPDRDSLIISGLYGFGSHAFIEEFDPDLHAFTIRLTGSTTLFEQSIPAGDSGWKVTTKGVATWRSPLGVSPKVILTVNPLKHTIKLTATKVEFPSAPAAELSVEIDMEGHMASSANTWASHPKIPGLFRFL